ncbi:PAS domain S-box protein [Aliifodinibius sp. S!AR15-10]|uniref:sensor histidine kinase n=1 Tax=Aliifodinibius sp. S!AR15-10 TaxID=2950437 RepID=UPI002863BC71|nr:histidine kinase dimerization/phosphoacceptor domain -containing protein [Aliifodinibius sp. S!AR15-10]MDR8390437.1 PAS domain S-box protein [Aliifodinibius sp. S!AR15-10]
MVIGAQAVDTHLQVLVIEDTPTDAELLIHRLRKQDFTFDHHLAESAGQTRAALENYQIDLVISDFHMPGFDGTQALQIVKDFDPMIPFILLSGSIDQDQETKILQLGADEVIMKSNLNRLAFSVRRVLYERHQKSQLKLLESVVTNTKDAVMILEAESNNLPGRKIVYVNEAFTQMTGYSKEEAIGHTPHLLNGPKTDKKSRQRLGKAMDSWKTCEVELLNYRKTGEEFWVNIFVRPVSAPNGGYSHWICIEREITDRIKREQQIRQSLKEKEVLLAEIHHRVKNNLAVVSGLLQLERFHSNQSEVQDILKKAELRIKSIATIHENLYKSTNFASLSFANYMDDIIESIQKAYESKQTTIELEKNIAQVSLNVNQAIPLGLMINELLTNAYKHAFPNKKKGHVKIEITQQGEHIILCVSDDGKGLPEEVTDHNVDSLGFTLIDTLVKQLHGTSTIKSDNGVNFRLEFQKRSPKGTANALNYNPNK